MTASPAVMTAALRSHRAALVPLAAVLLALAVCVLLAVVVRHGGFQQPVAASWADASSKMYQPPGKSVEAYGALIPGEAVVEAAPIPEAAPRDPFMPTFDPPAPSIPLPAPATTHDATPPARENLAASRARPVAPRHLRAPSPASRPWQPGINRDAPSSSPIASSRPGAD